MDIDGDLALAHMLDREMNCRPTRSTRRRFQEQAVPPLKEPVRPSSDHTRTKRQRPGCKLDGVLAAADPSSEASDVHEDKGGGRATAQLSPAVSTLVDSANRPVLTFPWIWQGNDSCFPCLPQSTDGRQRLLWEAELVGSYVMLPCVTNKPSAAFVGCSCDNCLSHDAVSSAHSALFGCRGSVWKAAAADQETLTWAGQHMNDLYLVTVKEYLPHMDSPPGGWLVQYNGEPPFHVMLHDIWPWLEPHVRKHLVNLGAPLPSKWCLDGSATAGSLFSIYASSIGIDPQKEKHLLWVAERGFNAPVPDGWELVVNANGVRSYRKKAMGDNLWCRGPLGHSENDEKWEHPLDEQLRDLVRVERAERSNPPKRNVPLGGRATAAKGRGSGHGGRGRVRGRQNVN